MEDFQTLINWGSGAGIAAISWFARQLWDAVQSLKTDLAELREQIARDYTPRNDFKELANELRSMFREISDKLDKKADK